MSVPKIIPPVNPSTPYSNPPHLTADDPSASSGPTTRQQVAADVAALVAAAGWRNRNAHRREPDWLARGEALRQAARDDDVRGRR